MIFYILSTSKFSSIFFNKKQGQQLNFESVNMNKKIDCSSFNINIVIQSAGISGRFPKLAFSNLNLFLSALLRDK